MSGDAVSDFIFECAAQNIRTSEDIQKEALRQIQEIDQKLLEADKLRPKRTDLEKVYQHFGGMPVKQAAKKKKSPVVSQDTPVESLDSDTKNLCQKICEHLAKVGSATNRELMVSCGVSIEDDRVIYASIKWLLANGIASKDEATRAIIKGPKWESRL